MYIRICLKNCLLAKGLRALILRTNPDWTVAVNKEPFPILPRTDLFLTDGAVCCQALRAKAAEARFILIDPGFEEQDITYRLLNEQYDGVFGADFNPDLLDRALNSVYRGEIWLEQKHLRELVNLNSRDQVRSPHLTPREQTIAALVGEGLRNRQIADRLCVCEQTIKSNLSRIYQKLNISNRAQLVRLVTTHPDVPPPP